MPSPSTSTLRSGTKFGSRLSGAGAFEKSCIDALGRLLLERGEEIAAEPAATAALLRGAGR